MLQRIAVLAIAMFIVGSGVVTVAFGWSLYNLIQAYN
jgi:hypothetical protein